MAKRWIRSPDAVIRTVGDEVFIAIPGGSTIHALNAIGAAIWRALMVPRSPEELLELFATAFPDTDVIQLRKDVLHVVSVLSAEKLIIEPQA
jgi:hypothetical protein